MDTRGRVDAEAFQRILERLRTARVDAICVLGSTGTYAYLRREERARALKIAAECLGGDKPLMSSVGALRTSEAVALAQDAASAGVSLGLLAPISYTPLNEDEVFAHFQTVAAEGGLPICIYDNPASTHFAIGDDLMARLAGIPNVVAAKSPAPSAENAAARITELRARARSGFSIGFSGDRQATDALIAGADAWYSVLGGLFPAPLVAITAAVAGGDLDTAHRTNEALQPMWGLMQEHSGIRVMYAAAEIEGVCDAAPPLPIQRVSAGVRTKIEVVLDALRPMLSGETFRTS